MDRDQVWSASRRLMGVRMTIAEWLGTAVMLGVPYLAIGVVWLAFHADHLGQSSGIHRVVVVLASIASWPVLMGADVCFT